MTQAEHPQTEEGRPAGLHELEREVCNCMGFQHGYGTHHADYCPVYEARRQWIARRIDVLLAATR